MVDYIDEVDDDDYVDNVDGVDDDDGVDDFDNIDNIEDVKDVDDVDKVDSIVNSRVLGFYQMQMGIGCFKQPARSKAHMALDQVIWHTPSLFLYKSWRSLVGDTFLWWTAFPHRENKKHFY